MLVVCDEESFTQVKIVVVNNRLPNRWYLSNKEMGRVWQSVLYIRWADSDQPHHSMIFTRWDYIEEQESLGFEVPLFGVFLFPSLTSETSTLQDNLK